MTFRRYIFIIISLLTAVADLKGQYLSNPSFEGQPALGSPPAGWEVCEDCSTVDTEPGYLHSTPASDGSTYIGMVGRGPYSNPNCTETCEFCRTTLETPLSPGSCYAFHVDIMYQPVYWGGFNYSNPLKLEIWGGTAECSAEILLWSSPAPELSWNTHSFFLTPDFEITELELKSHWTGNTTYWGNIMVDHLVIENASPPIDLGDDLTICYGDTVTLDAGNDYENYLWNTGETGSSITVYESGTYWVSGSNGANCTASDTIQITVNPPLEIDLGNDTTLCVSQELVLSVPDIFENYLWNTGETVPSITVTETGTYSVLVEDESGCTASDTILVEFEYEEIYIGNDTVLCTGDSLFLDAGSGFLSYLWNTGAESQTITVYEPGDYWVIVESESGCTAVDTISVGFEDETVVDLGNDTTLCYGTAFLLMPGLYNSYQWNDGSTLPWLEVNEPGIYWVNVLGGCNWASDTIEVDYYPPVNPYLGPDTTVCSPYILSPEGNFESYLWQDGSTGTTFQVLQTGIYSVTVELYGCQGYDEIFVKYPDGVNIEPEYELCTGDTLVIQAENDYDFYIWKNEAGEIIGNQNIIEIINGGTYFITAGVNNNEECNVSDTIQVVEIHKPLAELNNTGLCEGDSLSLTVMQDTSFFYLWNTGETEAEIIVKEEGTYWVKISNACGSSSDTCHIIEYPLPEVDLGKNYYLLENENEQIILDAGGGFETYQWQDGSTGQYYTVTFNKAVKDTVFYVNVFDGHCHNGDTVIIEAANIQVPILLTPNGDTYNDIFKPAKNWLGVKKHKIRVFNRWGQLVWESENFPEGWDGTSKYGGKVPDGTYYWILQVTVGRGIKRVYKGSLTVLSSR